MVELYPEDPRGDLRWRLALCGMDWLLADLGFDLCRRRQVVGRLRTAFAAEHHVDASVRRQLGNRYRKERAALETLLTQGRDREGALAPGLLVLRRRSQQGAPGMAALRERAAAGVLAQTLPVVAASFLHLHANRLLRSAQRAQEMVLYDFLARLYESHAARGQEHCRA
jgi:thiopeptide-type bacteriocin biosynthesis protein